MSNEAIISYDSADMISSPAASLFSRQAMSARLLDRRMLAAVSLVAGVVLAGLILGQSGNIAGQLFAGRPLLPLPIGATNLPGVAHGIPVRYYAHAAGSKTRHGGRQKFSQTLILLRRKLKRA